MANTHFKKAGKVSCKVVQVVEVEIVAGIKAKPYFVSNFCSPDKITDSFFAVYREEACLRLGIEFHPVGSGLNCIPDHLFIGFNKN